MGKTNTPIEFHPAPISEFSNFSNEGEVLWPPHTPLRLFNVKGNQVWLETKEHPSVWELVRNSKWAEVGKWIERNADRVDTDGCKWSLMGYVTDWLLEGGLGLNQEDIFDAGVPDSHPIKLMVDKGAKLTEKDPAQRWATPAKKVVRSAMEGVVGPSKACLELAAVLLELGVELDSCDALKLLHFAHQCAVRARSRQGDPIQEMVERRRQAQLKLEEEEKSKNQFAGVLRHRTDA